MTDWEKIVERHAPMVWTTAFRLLNNHADASDCVQETFLAALETVRREPVRNWSGLLARVCTCRALDQLRRRIRDRRQHEQLVESSDFVSSEIGPAERTEQIELSDGLRTAVSMLSDRQGEVFCLRYFSQMSYQQIARATGIQTSAVSVMLHRSRIQLWELLKAYLSDSANEVLP
jgi:RNA polymerase sigma-70 factor (ECF subfamily)